MAFEKVLPYPRTQVKQDTYYNCGPASCQTVIFSTGKLIEESELARRLGTTRNGTNWIGSFPAVLNDYIDGAEYVHVEMPDDPPTREEKERLWQHLVDSITAGHGVVANIVAPPSNYPRAVAPSTISPAYAGGWVYHYVAAMGVAQDADGRRRVWIADSGFAPYGYWIDFEQLCSLIPPKGYAYSKTKVPAPPSGSTRITQPQGGMLMALTDDQQRDLYEKVTRIHHEMTHYFDSRYDLDLLEQGKITPADVHEETLVGYILNLDRKIEDIHRNMLPTLAAAIGRIFKGRK